MSHVFLACRLVLVGVLLAVSAGRDRRRAVFHESAARVAEFGLVPVRFSRHVVLGLAAAEAGAAVLLAMPQTALLGLLCVTVLLLGSAIALGFALRHGRITTPYGPFARSRATSPARVVRNLVAVAVLAAGLMAAASPGGSIGQPRDVVIAGMSAALVMLAIVKIGSVAVLLSPPAERSRAVTMRGGESSRRVRHHRGGKPSRTGGSRR